LPNAESDLLRIGRRATRRGSPEVALHDLSGAVKNFATLAPGSRFSFLLHCDLDNHFVELGCLIVS